MRVLHCPIELHLRNTSARVKLRISRQRQQSIKPNMGPRGCGARAHGPRVTTQQPWMELDSELISRKPVGTLPLLSLQSLLGPGCSWRQGSGVKWKAQDMYLLREGRNSFSPPGLSLAHLDSGLTILSAFMEEKVSACSWWAILFWHSILNIWHHDVHWVPALRRFLFRCGGHLPVLMEPLFSWSGERETFNEQNKGIDKL